MAQISDIFAQEILDSRGNPTVEVEVAARRRQRRVGPPFPSGASTGSREARELRDGDKTRFGGKGVLHAVRNVEHVLAPLLRGEDARQQRDHRSEDDREGRHAVQGEARGQRHPGRLDRGGQGGRRLRRLPLYQYLGGVDAATSPVPMMNVLNGGKHADNNVDFQEFMIVPLGAPTFREALRMGAETFHALKKVLAKKGYNTAVGDEGGFAPA